MIQYLVTTFRGSTGRKHTHIARTKSNQGLIVVEVGSKKGTEEKYETQVKRDAITKLDQLSENIKECGK